MKTSVSVAVIVLAALVQPAAARVHHHRFHVRYYPPLSVRYGPYDAGYRTEVLGRTPFGDTVISGRMGYHRAFYAPGVGFNSMVRGSEEDGPVPTFLGSAP